MWKVYTKGRSYRQGKALSSNARVNIVDDICAKGGDKTTGIFPGKFIDIAKEHKVSTSTVSKLWTQYCESYELNPKHGGGNRKSLSEGDLHLIEVLKRQRPSITYTKILDVLHDVGDLPEGDTSLTSICNAVQSKLPGGQFTFKKITSTAKERFTLNNMAYTQLFIDYLYDKDPYTLKYFDECGIKLPSIIVQEITVTHP